MVEVKTKRVLVRRLTPGADLLTDLNKFARMENITLGALTGIGALRRAVVGIFDQSKGEYITRTFDEEMEICALVGNVSVKDGLPFVHAHLTLSDKNLVCYGGHVMPGCEVFVCEVTLWDLEGPTLVREPRAECAGLAVWALENEGTE